MLLSKDDHEETKKEEEINEINIGNDKIPKKSKWYTYIGIFIVLLIAVTSTTCAELAQFVVTDYNSAYVIVWFYVNFFSIPLFFEFILLKLELNKEKRINSQFKMSLVEKFKSKFCEKEKTSTKGISLKKIIITSIPMSILFVSLNWVYTIALSMTEVSISTALYQSASVFCFILSIIILREKIRLLKTISVVVFMAGVIGIAITTYDSSSKYPNAVKGDLLIILSAALWALYEVLTCKFIGDANRTVVNTYMGLIALVNFVVGIPVITILDATAYEPFILPNGKIFGFMVLSASVGLFYNYLINWGLSISSPLFVRSGELLSIPATLLFDIVAKNMKLPLLSIPGYILIIIGFIISVFNERKEIKKKENLRKEINEELSCN